MTDCATARRSRVDRADNGRLIACTSQSDNVNKLIMTRYVFDLLLSCALISALIDEVEDLLQIAPRRPRIGMVRGEKGKPLPNHILCHLRGHSVSHVVACMF